MPGLPSPDQPQPGIQTPDRFKPVGQFIERKKHPLGKREEAKMKGAQAAIAKGKGEEGLEEIGEVGERAETTPLGKESASRSEEVGEKHTPSTRQEVGAPVASATGEPPNFNSEASVEKSPRPSIILKFFRHDAKGAIPEGGTDNNVRLTQEGQSHAIEKGRDKSPTPETALALGSPRDRTVETAYAYMLSNEDIEGLSLEDIRTKVGEHVKVGKKEIITDKLNFNWFGSTGFTEAAYDHYNNGKDALRFLFEESDQLVVALGDKDSTSYSRAAGNVAQIVSRYTNIFDNWERITRNNPEKYQQFNNELQRFLGSHGGFTECFLMKVIEKTDGKEGVLQFIGSRKDPNQFGFSEGYSVVIERSEDGGKTIKVSFEDKSWTITPDMIEEIIKEGTIGDRFEKISSNYGDLFSEVFAEQGMDYDRLQKSVFDTVVANEPKFRELPILDIGIGDGATSVPFVEAGCTRLTGIDLNSEMIDATRVKFGNSIRLFQMNAIDMSAFNRGDFGIIVAGAAIHNIAKPSRKMFWGEILRLNPRTFVFAEKIKDADPTKHQAAYQREVAAIKKVYGERHGLQDAEGEWLRHYEYDERESLTLDEIRENIGNNYDVSVVSEMGLYKTVLAKRKE